MKKKFNIKKVGAIGAGAVLALSLAFGMAFTDFSKDTVATDEANAGYTQGAAGKDTDKVASNYAVTQVGNVLYDSTDASKLGTFENGTTYWYTDYNLGVKLSNGDASTTTDRVAVTVNKTGNAAGSKLNPYVINSTTDWASFVSYVASSGVNFGSGKYFVLNADLEYKGGQLPLVAQFSGTFYGTGHKITDPVYAAATREASNCVATGLFCYAQGYISDLSITNYKITSVANNVAPLVGIPTGAITVANVLTQGQITHDATQRLEDKGNKGTNTDVGKSVHANVFSISAFIATNMMDNCPTNFYKNTADIVATQTLGSYSTYAAPGGILGWVNTKSSSSPNSHAINAYDNFVSATYNCLTKADSRGTPAGAFTGFVAFTRYVPTSVFQNNVFIVNYNTSGLYNRVTDGSGSVTCRFHDAFLTTFGTISSTTKPVSTQTLTVKNFFGYGIATKGSTKYPVVFVNQYSGYYTSKTITNSSVYSYKDSAGKTVAAPNAVAAPTETSASLEVWLSKAKAALNSNIWVTGSLDGIKEPASGTAITRPNIVDTPIVINKTKITFADVTGAALTFADGKGAVREYELEEGGVTALPVPNAPAGKKFAGWTLDKTSDAKLYDIFPTKLYGNATMYPVWEMTGVTASSVAEVDEHNGEVKDKIVTAKYIGGGAVVTLTASVSLPCAVDDCKIEWSWFKKEGEEEVKLAGKTSNVLELSALTTGTYYAKVKVTNTKELWRTAEDVKSNEFDVSIEKGVLSPSGGISLAEKVGEGDQAKDVFAYWGQPLSELQDLVVAPMQNTAGIAVAGTITWDDPLTKVGDTQKTYEAYFHPTDTNNYEDNTPISVTILPTILQWKFEFAVNPQVDNVVFTFSEEYGKTYTRAQVAQRFEDTYFDWLNDIGEGDTRYAEMVGRTPYFGTEDITQYRGTNAVGAYFDKDHVADNGYIVKDKTTNSAVLNTPVAFNALNKSTMFTISLFREEQTNGTLATTTQQLGYGAAIPKPLKSLHMDGTTTQYLEGWFVTNATGEVLNTNGGVFTGAEGEERVSWDFATARVTGHTFLGAVWKDGFLKLTGIYASVNGTSTKTFTARTLAKPTDFVAVGIYTVYENETEMNRDNPRQDANGNPQTVELVLSSEDYRVSPEGSTTGTTEYHVGALRADNKTNYAVTIAHKTNHELFCTVPVTVVAKRLDMSGINFPNQTVQYKENETQYIGNASQEVAVALAPQGVQDGDYTIAYEYCNSSNTSINWNGGVKDIGLYYVYLQLNFNTDDFVAGRISATLTITPQPITVYAAWDADNQKEYVYNGQIQHPNVSFYTLNEDGSRTPVTITFVYTGNSEQKIANADGVYSRIGVELRNSRYQLADDAMSSIEFRINRAKVRLPQLANNSFEFKNDIYNIAEYIGYDADTLEFLVEVRNGVAKDVPSSGTITSQVRLRDAINSEWEDGTSGEKQIVWTITAKVMTVPTFTETLVYTGTPFKVSEHLNFFDEVITVFGSETEATNAGMYRVNLRLPTENGGKNYVWDKKDFNGTVEWQIQKAELYLSWDGWSYLYNGSTYSPRAKISFGLVDADMALQNQDPRFIYTGDADKRESGSYKINVSIGQTSELYKNYVIAKDSATFYWVIKESADEVVITVVWDMPVDGGYTYNGEIQYPKVKALYSENGMGEEDLDKYDITYTGDWNKSKYKGTYSVSVEITAEDNTPLRIRQGEASYVIRRNSAGEGEDPDAGKQPDGPGTIVTPPSEDTVSYPVIQLIIGGVGAVLFAIFTVKTFGYASSTNEAKKKTKELAQISYSFVAPFGLLAVGNFLGLGDGAWWGISIGILGLAILMGAVMFVFRGKNKKALAALAEEQARVDDEKEAAKEMQRQRRDDEFKMMFAAMQQNYQQPAVNYDDMQNMISSAVTALLPTMQQQLQALPPAQSETDDLRSLMEQQQEMLNQLMQERQVQQDYQPQYNAAQGGEDYAELKRIIAEQEEMLNKYKFKEDTSLGTLEELYGKMSDEAKRCYYEIGGYIMSKPDTAQNDGKYAVLFKYRGITLFKLFIKNNAPVLAYTLDNEAQAELFIEDESVLEDAKQIVNMRIRKVDRDMNK